MESKFKEITFKTEADFNEWLEKTTFKKIFLKDKGQDLMKLWISESGEILNANMQSSIWNGRFVNLETLAKNTNLCLWNKDKSEWDVMNFEIRLVK